ncbi:g9373 [Coccomyxa viridis]|uniref:G9373 protein n=1 Tax=Coccomyxa viridis TaxID=1274662 RepID=A0ABP1G7K8_9CHLO
MRLRTLDLFSGLGGFSYALHAVCKTVAYCEIDQNCHIALKGAMDAKLIDRAPIYSDIQAVTGKMLPKKIDMITAGFPCPDISISGLGAGLEGERSGLIREIFRLVDERPDIDMVLLENSPMLTTRGYSDIRDFFHRRGFVLLYGIFSAAEVGGPHKRRRFYGLATKRDLKRFKLPLIRVPDQWAGREPCPRLIPRPSDKLVRQYQAERLKMLGNAVCPQTVAYAFYTLVHGAQGRLRAPLRGRLDPVRHILAEEDGVSVSLMKPTLDHPVPLTKPSSIEWDGLRCRVGNWPTPVADNWHQCRRLGRRTCDTLVNQIFFDRATLDAFDDGSSAPNYLSLKYMVNPDFVEFLMGYPLGFSQGPI